MALKATARKDMPFNDLVALGLIPGVKSIHKYGRNPDIDVISGFEAIWNGGGEYTGFNAVAAEIVTVVSSDAADDSAGTGARTIKLFGLDTNGFEQTEIVTLDGATPVDSVKEYLRLDRAKCMTAGSGGTNAGVITIRQKTTTANIFAVLPIGYGSTMIAAYTIPAGKVGLYDAWFSSFAGKTTADCNVRLNKRESGGCWQVQEEHTLRSAGSSAFPREFKVPKDGLPALTDIYVSADTDANDTGLAAGFDLKLYDV